MGNPSTQEIPSIPVTPPQSVPDNPPQPSNPLSDLMNMFKSMLWSAGFVSYLLVIISSFIIVMAMTPAIQEWITTPVGGEYPDVAIFVITPWPILLFRLSGSGFQAWHLLMLGILGASVSYALYDLLKSWLSKKQAALASLTVPEKAKSSFETVGKLFMAALFFSTVYFLFLELINVEMNVPPFDELAPPVRVYEMFTASVFEELISRVLLIGVPLVLIGFALKWKDPAKKILGGGLGITPVTMVFITISSVIFAFAHAGGWDYWKVPQVLIPAFALGYAFVKYGLHASIMLHFSINLYLASMEVWPESVILQMALSTALLIWLVAGGYFFFRYCFDFLKILAPGLFPAPQPSAAPPVRYVPPPTYYYNSPPPVRYCLGCGRQVQPDYNVCPHCGKRIEPIQKVQPPVQNVPAARPLPQPNPRNPPGSFVCPNCGHTSASYDSGRLTCLKCGTVHMRDGQEPKKEEKEMVEF